MWDALNTLELNILDMISGVRCTALDLIMPIITLLGEDGIFFISLAVVMLFFPRTRKCGICIGAALLMGFVIGNLTLKPLLCRMRPYDFNSDYNAAELLVGTLRDYSFPSGHTLCVFEGSVVLFLTQRRAIGVPALILAALVAFSRLYLYVHYPTDVIAGALLGTLFAVLSCAIVERLYPPHPNKNRE